MSSVHRVSSGHRGRPRQSSTAAPDTARRAQLREAQRAYRSRQQSLLTSLKSRVAILEDAFAQLSQIMNSFDAQVNKPGAQMSHPQLLQAVKILQNKISSQLRKANCHASPNESSCTTQAQEGQQAASGSQSPGHHQDDEPTTNTSTWTREKAYSSQFWRLFLGSSNGFLPPVKPANHKPSPCIRMIPSIEGDNRAIKYTTTPFAQRLFRTCAEAGYRCLMNNTVTDEEMWPQFGLVLQCVSREQTRLYFERVLRMSPCNPTYDRRFPFMCLGGAGTHFSPPVQGSHSRNLLLFHESNGVWELPSDEQWFDVKDIEGFLVEQGIRVGGDYQPSILPANGVLNMRHQPLLQTGNIAGSYDLSISNQVIPSDMVMVLDENTVIDRLSRLCVCLGCVPGFRRSEVENLIWQNVSWKPV